MYTRKFMLSIFFFFSKLYIIYFNTDMLEWYIMRTSEAAIITTIMQKIVFVKQNVKNMIKDKHHMLKV